MLRVCLICVGKLKERFYQEACDEYVKRLAKEATAIRGRIPPSARVVALCVEGRLRSSEEMARMFPDLAYSREKCLVFLIGGSYGLDETLKSEAQVRLSMSPMTFPHHLARVMLLEQIYRGAKINEGGRYHK